ncbi:MAG: helix-turn-helix domain-containing protein [Nitrososphaerales archaeon]
MSEERVPFTTWLKRRRCSLDLTQKALAAQAGCALTTLQKIERGARRPSRHMAQRLAAVLGVPPSEQAAFIAYARTGFPGETRRAPVVAPSTAAAAPWQVAPPPRHNLPLQFTSFIGRERVIAEVTRLLGYARMVTLTSADGSGKTRLALRVAETLVDHFPDGVWWVDLARLADAEVLPQAVAAGLGLRAEGERPLLEQLADYVQHRRLLLLLDNCEHLVTACAGLAEAFLRAAPGLTILATSREPLAIASESPYLVPTLQTPGDGPLPPLAELLQVESVRLFGERAAAARPDFKIQEGNAAPVAEICRRLDGIPMAIELAAARAKELEVEELCHRLDDRFDVLTGGSRTALPRHRTLRATLDWSYGLLAGEERVLLRRQAVFSGGWDPEAAEAVCAGDDLQGQVLELTSRLVDKSLVVLGWRGQAGRYGTLEAMHEYALERLAESGEESRLRRAHAEYFLALAERAEPLLFTPQQNTWLDRLEDEHANLRKAYATLREEGEAVAALRLAGALGRFWEVRGDFAEGQAWLNEMLAKAGDAAEPAVRAKALLGAGIASYFQRDHATAAAQLRASVALYRALGDRHGAGRALYYLGSMEMDLGALDEARALMESSATICREIDDRQGLGWALARLGVIKSWGGDAAAGRPLLEEGLALCREVDDKPGIAWSLQMLTATLLALQEYGQAQETAKEGVLRCRELGAHRNLSFCLYGGGLAMLLSGDPQGARPWLREALVNARDVGKKMMVAQALACYGMLCLAEESPAQTLRSGGTTRALGREATAAWLQGRPLPLEELIAEALEEETDDAGTNAVLSTAGAAWPYMARTLGTVRDRPQQSLNWRGAVELALAGLRPSQGARSQTGPSS